MIKAGSKVIYTKDVLDDIKAGETGIVWKVLTDHPEGFHYEVRLDRDEDIYYATEDELKVKE